MMVRGAGLRYRLPGCAWRSTALHARAASRHCSGSASSDLPPSTLDEALRAIADLKAQLRGRDDVIRQLVKQHAAHSAVAPWGGADGAGEVVVRDGAELLAAIEEGVNVISLDGSSGQPFDLGPTPVPIHRKRIELRPDRHSLVEPGTPPPEIHGHLAIRGGAHVALRGVVLVATSPDRPVLELASKSALVMCDCVVRGGRDGVYVSGEGAATLAGCTVQGNTRGVFEMHRCRVLLANCRFVDNTFHAVLLATAARHNAAAKAKPHAPPSSSSPPPAGAPGPHSCHTAGCSFAGGRGDVCTAYNPVADEYARVFRAATGVELSLATDERTTNLVDPTW